VELAVPKRKTLLVLVVGMAAFAGTILILVLDSSPPGNGKYDRVRIGMSRVEVTTILGPPGDDGIAPVESLRGEELFGGESWIVGATVLMWSTDEFGIYVYFDPAGQVSHIEHLTIKRKELGVIEAVVLHAQRQWRRWFP
jgi:hypothetical protein